MLRTASELKGIAIAATDGDIGSVKDLYFDDMSWTVRYLVVDTGTWLPGRQVLVSPMSIRGGSSAEKIAVSLTREEVKNSPPIDADKPVNRQEEIELSRYYSYPYYWAGPYRWGLLAYPGLPPTAPPVDPVAAEMAAREREQQGDPNLRSVRDVTGYTLAALDGDIGHVEDFVVDDHAWAIRYMMIDTKNWWPGKKVVISPEWIREVSWADSKVHVDLTRSQVQSAPEYDPSRPIERDYEERLFQYHGRRKYWEWEDR